jgi:hypothetical protein
MKSLFVLPVSVLLAVSMLVCPMAMSAPPSMPDDVQLVQPDPTLPKELAAFWGQWESSFSDSDKFKEIQMTVVVEKVTEEKAILRSWRAEYGWSPKREAIVTKENGKYKLWFEATGSNYGKIEITLEGELLLWNIPARDFSTKLKRVAEK